MPNDLSIHRQTADTARDTDGVLRRAAAAVVSDSRGENLFTRIDQRFRFLIAPISSAVLSLRYV
jgi:hypothetical protein